MTFHRVATARRARSQPCVGHASGQNGYSLTAHTVQASTCQHTSRAGPSPRRAQPRDGTAPRRIARASAPVRGPGRADRTGRIMAGTRHAPGAAAHARTGGQRAAAAPPAARSPPQRAARARARREARLPHSRRRRAARVGRGRVQGQKLEEGS